MLPSQQEIYDNLTQLSKKFAILILRGESGSGKHFILQHFFKRKHINLINFSICDLCRDSSHQISSQDLVAYFDSLTKKALERLQENKPTPDKASDCLRKKKSKKAYIYIRRLDLLHDILSDYGMRLRNLTKLVIMRWLEYLPKHIHVIITSSVSIKIDNVSSWTLELSPTPADIGCLLRSHHLSSEDQARILKLTKIPVLSHVFESLKYARALIPSKPSDSSESFFSLYKKAYIKLSGSNLDPDRDVPHPQEKFDLVGMEKILEEIRTSIIYPIELNHPSVSVKKGIVLCGPSGTGKTTIGRWLAHQLKGKLYLLGGEIGRGSVFLDAFNDIMERARYTSPSVVFIDDVDSLFTSDELYRGFLTILDGLNNKRRTNVCVIVTCMDISRLPASLLRGGRLELCIFTQLPTAEHLAHLLENGFQKIIKVIKEITGEISISPSNSFSFDSADFSLLTLNKKDIEAQCNSQLIKSLTIQMTGWNCADVVRCIDDVLRLLITGKKFDVGELFSRCIKSIRKQYEYCDRSYRYLPSLNEPPSYVL